MALYRPYLVTYDYGDDIKQFFACFAYSQDNALSLVDKFFHHPCSKYLSIECMPITGFMAYQGPPPGSGNNNNKG